MKKIKKWNDEFDEYFGLDFEDIIAGEIKTKY